jgi:hypothetical protein
MDINRYKSFFPFIISIVLFIIAAIFALTTLLGLDDPVEKSENSVEVNLPVVNWAKYSNLSKKLDNDSINIVK